MENKQTAFSKLPPVQEIDAYLAEQGMKHGREVRDQIQTLLSEIRADTKWISQEETTREIILAYIKSRLEQDRQALIPLINATGAVIHTNLGRSVFSREVFEDVIDIATSYTNLEFSLETGKRGARLSIVGSLLKTLTGAEDAVVVNNNAAAVLLTLIAFAQGKEVIISRGELVEIGGSFRIPEVISVSGAILKEIGATNRTHLSDYENAITEETAILLKVHTSNYRIEGFTEKVPATQLAKLAQKEGKILVEDLGSGALSMFTHPQLNSEPMVPQIIRDGIDIVTFSGDKLLGGPQAGIIVGKKAYMEKIRKHPLYRALRCDKLTMLLLEKTLIAYTRNRQGEQVPTQRMLNESEQAVKVRAEAVLSGLDPERFQLVTCESTPGGGSLPGTAIASWGILVNHPELTENRLLDQLRASDLPVIGRIQDGAVVLDCRTVLPHQIDLLQKVLLAL
jgi:L-seryl-tRNA(Ser) seleniumtransferase